MQSPLCWFTFKNTFEGYFWSFCMYSSPIFLNNSKKKKKKDKYYQKWKGENCLMCFCLSLFSPCVASIGFVVNQQWNSYSVILRILYLDQQEKMWTCLNRHEKLLELQTFFWTKRSLRFLRIFNKMSWLGVRVPSRGIARQRTQCTRPEVYFLHPAPPGGMGAGCRPVQTTRTDH